MAELPREEITDPAALRMLAHPLRNRIAELMRRGPVSSTTLAQALGESTGLTSYHLRQMAKHGFVEEVPGLARGRERWWRFVPADRRFPPYGRQSPKMRAAMEEMQRLAFADDLDKLSRFQRQREQMGEWADAVPFSRGEIHVTFDELQEFFEDYIALLNRYRRADDEMPPGGRAVLTRFLAFPDPDAPLTDAATKADAASGTGAATGRAATEAGAATEGSAPTEAGAATGENAAPEAGAASGTGPATEAGAASGTGPATEAGAASGTDPTSERGAASGVGAGTGRATSKGRAAADAGATSDETADDQGGGATS